MTITCSTCGVWTLDDSYKKAVLGYFSQNSADLTVGGLWSWGYGGRGQLGIDSNINRSSPVQVPGDWISIANAGYSKNFALKADRTLWSWGCNSSAHAGSLGLNDIIPRSSPVQVPGTNWCLATGAVIRFSAIGLKTDGTLWTWGYGGSGALGLGTTINRSSPTQIPGSSWSDISIEGHGMALKTDGTLWTWGYSNFGQLGLNNITAYSSPVQIPGVNWACVSTGTNISAALKTDGTLWVWGRGSYGVLGLNNTIYRSSPTQLPGTSWFRISKSLDRGMTAIKTDGTLWVWGCGGYGELGNNAILNKSSPTQIPGTSWCSSASARFSTIALKTDGTLWNWGKGNNGQLGQNDNITRSSPVQVPGTGWYKIAGLNYAHSALKTN